MWYIQFQRPKWCNAFSKFPLNAISLSSVLENEARRLLGANGGCCIPEGEERQKALPQDRCGQGCARGQDIAD